VGKKWGGIQVGGGIAILKWEVATHNPTPLRGSALVCATWVPLLGLTEFTVSGLPSGPSFLVPGSFLELSMWENKDENMSWSMKSDESFLNPMFYGGSSL